MSEKASFFVKYAKIYFDKFIDYLPTLVGAILLLVIGWWLIKVFVKRLNKLFEKRNMDIALKQFLTSLISVFLKLILILIVVSQLGIQITSLIALLGAAGLAVGLALQGSLSNFAGGIIILVLRPFRIGDWIETQGISGSVTEIHLFYTKITTAGNQLAVIPNAQVSNGNIINYTVLNKRQDFLTFNIGYKSDLKQAKEILLQLMNENDKILKDPASEVVVTTLGESSVSLSARFWANNDDFWGVHFYIIEEGQLRLAAAGIELPTPQRNIHVYQEPNK